MHGEHAARKWQARAGKQLACPCLPFAAHSINARKQHYKASTA